MIRARLMLVFLMLFFAAPLASAGDDDLDLNKVSPADLGGVKVDDLVRIATTTEAAFETGGREVEVTTRVVSDLAK